MISKNKPNHPTNVKLKEALLEISQKKREKKIFNFEIEKDIINIKFKDASDKEKVFFEKKEISIVKLNILKIFNEIGNKKYKSV